MKINRQEVIGLVPAAGKATRLAPLPCSKELLPLGFRSLQVGQSLQPKVACHYLLEKMKAAHITKAHIILRKGKWDIPAYLGDGKMLGMHLSYLIMNLPFGVPYTLDQAFPFVQKAIVAFGFPDILFQPDDAYIQLLARLAESRADVVLGLFPSNQPEKMDMVDLDAVGRIRGIQIKPAKTDLRHTWIIAVWTPVFSRFIHDYISTNQQSANRNHGVVEIEDQPELFLGDVIQAAVHRKVPIETVIFREGSCLDIGTPEDLVKAFQMTN